MSEVNPEKRFPNWLIVLMFAGLYTTWSTTYLAIYYMVKTIPPYLSSGLRFLVAGAILYGFARIKNKNERISLKHWKSALITGGLVIWLGNGSVVWGEKYISSSLAALLIATVPLWIVLLNWLLFGGGKPGVIEMVGVVLGFLGVALLIVFTRHIGGEGYNLKGIVIVLAASISWATGSLYSRYSQTPSSPLLSVAAQMLAGGALMFLASFFVGEWATFELSRVSMVSVLSWAYLVVFGSLVGFVCYMTLMKVCRPSKVATYAYVTPVGAVFLGWLIAGDTITYHTLIAGGIIILAVLMIISFAPKE
jgi:drug/metabolite transporter (DMT)-like permease